MGKSYKMKISFNESDRFLKTLALLEHEAMRLVLYKTAHQLGDLREISFNEMSPRLDPTLSAPAPDLLEALKESKGAIEMLCPTFRATHGNSPEYVMVQEAFEKIRAAIAKAAEQRAGVLKKALEGFHADDFGSDGTEEFERHKKEDDCYICKIINSNQ
jgi:hypothetical protein